MSLTWQRQVEILKSRFPRFSRDGKEPSRNGYAMGFQLPNGRQIAVNTKGNEAMVWIEQCDPLPHIAGLEVRNEKFSGMPYSASQPRKSSLNYSVAPNLKGPNSRTGHAGKPVYCLNVTSEPAFLELLDWYANT